MEPSIALKYTQKLGTEPSIANRLLGVQLKHWWYLQLVLLVLCLVFIIAALAAPVWVRQGQSALEFQGGLLKCSSCIEEINGDMYSTIQDEQICSSGAGFDGLCSMVKDLNSAGGTYLAFSIVTVILILLWIVKVVFCILEMPFLTRELILVIPLFALLANFIGFVVWAGVSKAKYSGSCDAASGKSREDVCSDAGAGLALFVLLFLACVAVYFRVVYKYREGKAEYKLDKLDNQT